MPKLIKILSLLIGVIFLSHCAGGPNNRRMGFVVNPNQPQSGDALTSQDNNRSMFLQNMMQSLRGQLDQNPIDMPPKIKGPVTAVEPLNWDKLCETYKGDDTDKDGISDNCETELL